MPSSMGKKTKQKNKQLLINDENTMSNVWNALISFFSLNKKKCRYFGWCLMRGINNGNEEVRLILLSDGRQNGL